MNQITFEFFKVFLPNSGSQHLSIPPAFLKHLNGTFPQKATIKDHTGKSWCVTLEKEDGLVYFKNGWQAFVDYHFLKYGYFLVFQYDGNCTFDVKIFGKNGCKKAVVAESAHSVPIVEDNSVPTLDTVVGVSGNVHPILKVKEEYEDEIEKEDPKPSIPSKRKRSQVSSTTAQKPRRSKRGRPRNVSKAVENVDPKGPVFERTMKRWSNKTIEFANQQNDLEEDVIQEKDQIEGADMDMTNEIPPSQSQEIIYLGYQPLQTVKEDNMKSANMSTIDEAANQKNDQYFQEDVLQESNQSERPDMDMTNEMPSIQSQEIIYLGYQPLQINKEDNMKSANMNISQEVVGQQNDQYFQEDVLQENNQSVGADMDMEIEIPPSQSQEIIYLGYQPLLTHKEDNMKSANIDTTELHANSFDEETNIEQVQSPTKSANMDATGFGGNSFDKETSIEQEESPTKSTNIDSTEIGGNSFEEGTTIQQQVQSPIKLANMANVEIDGNLFDEETNIEQQEQSPTKIANMDSTELGENSIDEENNIEQQEQSPTKSANMDSTEFCENSIDEEINTEQQEQFPTKPVNIDTPQLGGNSFDEETNIEQQEQSPTKIANMDSTELAGNSIDEENNIEKQEQSPTKSANMDSTKFCENSIDEEINTEQLEQFPIKSVNIDTPQLGGNSFDEETNIEQQEQSSTKSASMVSTEFCENSIDEEINTEQQEQFPTKLVNIDTPQLGGNSFDEETNIEQQEQSSTKSDNIDSTKFCENSIDEEMDIEQQEQFPTKLVNRDTTELSGNSIDDETNVEQQEQSPIKVANMGCSELCGNSFDVKTNMEQQEQWPTKSAIMDTTEFDENSFDEVNNIEQQEQSRTKSASVDTTGLDGNSFDEENNIAKSANVDTNEFGENSFDKENNINQQERFPTKLANMDTTELDGSSLDEEKNIEQQVQSSAKSANMDTSEVGGNSFDEEDNIEQEQIPPKLANIDTVEVGGNSLDDKNNTEQQERCHAKLADMNTMKMGDNSFEEENNIEMQEQSPAKSANVDTNVFGENSFDEKNNTEQREQSHESVKATRKKKKNKFRGTTNFDREEQSDGTSYIYTDQDSTRDVRIKKNKKFSEHYVDEDCKRIKKAKKGTKQKNSSEQFADEDCNGIKRGTKQKKIAEQSTDEDCNSIKRAKKEKKQKKISEQSADEDGNRIKRAKKGTNSRIFLTLSEHDKELDIYKEYPLLLPKSKWSTTQRINLHGKPDVISTIKNMLNERQLQKFKRSCFGNFLDFNITKFSSQLFYHLIRRQCSSKKRNELWFNLEGRIHKFGIKDFALITGLNCEELPAIDMSKIQKAKFNRKYFGGEKTITRTKLHKVFVEMDKGKNKDVVKMAKLYMLEMFILSKQKITGINHEHMLLIDDKEQFERYPWGRISYEITIDYAKKSILKSHDASAIGVGGFPFALIVWAYETIPLLSVDTSFFAKRMSFGTPRMNNWAASVHPEFKDLSEKVFQSDSFEVQPMIATKTELSMPFMLPFGGVEPSKEKSKSPLAQEQNSDAADDNKDLQ